MDPEALKEAQEGQAELHVSFQSTLYCPQLRSVLQKSIGDLASGGGFAKLLSGEGGADSQQNKQQARKKR